MTFYLHHQLKSLKFMANTDVIFLFFKASGSHKFIDPSPTLNKTEASSNFLSVKKSLLCKVLVQKLIIFLSDCASFFPSRGKE